MGVSAALFKFKRYLASLWSVKSGIVKQVIQHMGQRPERS